VIHKNGMLEMSIINVIFLTNVEKWGRVVIYLLLTIDDNSIYSVDENRKKQEKKILGLRLFFFSISSMDAMMLGNDKQLDVCDDGVSIRSLTKPEKSILLTNNRYEAWFDRIRIQIRIG